VATVLAFVPDLLFGSNLLGALTAAGHEARLVSTADQLASGLPEADVVIVDLTAEPESRIEQARPALEAQAVRTLAFFAHVEADIRAAAEQGGFDLVVPRSRMARAAGELVSSLAETAG
jgi:hypothetical protein